MVHICGTYILDLRIYLYKEHLVRMGCGVGNCVQSVTNTILIVTTQCNAMQCNKNISNTVNAINITYNIKMNYQSIVMISCHVLPSSSGCEFNFISHVFSSYVIQFTDIFTIILIIYRSAAFVENAMGLAFGNF